MEFLYSSFDLLSSSLFLLKWQDGAGAIILVIVSGLLIYSGFPLAFILVGSAVLFAVYALVSGGMVGTAFAPFAEYLEKLLTNETLLALPLFLFTVILIERVFIAEELIHKLINHWRQKSEAMLFTVSLLDIVMTGLAAVICVFYAPFAALKMPLLLKNKNISLLEPQTIKTLFSKGPLSQPGFIPITIMLILTAELVSNASEKAIDYAKDQQLVLEQEIISYTPQDFFIAALIPSVIFISVYCLYHLCLMFKYPNDYVFKTVENERDTIPTRRRELLKSLLAPGLYAVIVLGALLLIKLTIIEVAAIAAIGSIFLASHKLSPQKSNIYLNATISFLALFGLSNLFTLDLYKFEATPLNGAILAISFFFLSYIVYGIFYAVMQLVQSEISTPEQSGHSFMSEILIETYELTSKFITLLIAAALYIILFEALGGDELLKVFYEKFTGNNSLAILTTVVFLLVTASVFTPLVALLVAVPILLPQLLLFAKMNGIEFNLVWFGILIIITLQTLWFYAAPMKEIEENIKNQSTLEILKPQIYQARIPLIIFQLLVLTLCWLFPKLVLGLGAMI